MEIWIKRDFKNINFQTESKNNMTRLENINRLRKFLSEALKLPEQSIEFKEAQEKFAAPNLYVSTLVKGYGDSPKDIEEIRKAADYNSSLSEVKRKIHKKCGIPEECIVFLKPNGDIVSGNCHVSTLRNIYENFGDN